MNNASAAMRLLRRWKQTSMRNDLCEVLQTRVMDEVDVLVAGGGVSGLVAAIAGARLGARVLVVERQAVLGGAATSGMVAQWLGFFHREVQAVRGIPAQLARQVIEAGGSPGFTRYVLAEASADPLPVVSFPFDPEILKLVLDTALIESGAQVLFHSGAASPLVEGNVVRGLVLETISGRSAVLARVVIDATGDGTVAARAGAMTMGEEEEQRRCRQPGTLVFRLSGVDGPRFRAVPRTENSFTPPGLKFRADQGATRTMYAFATLQDRVAPSHSRVVALYP